MSDGDDDDGDDDDDDKDWEDVITVWRRYCDEGKMSWSGDWSFASKFCRYLFFPYNFMELRCELNPRSLVRYLQS